MKSDKLMRSKIYRFLDYVFRLIILNALIIVPSFSFSIIASNFIEIDNPLGYLALIPIVLWLFPSCVATGSVIRQYETKETNTIFKDFFKNLKRTYGRSLIFSFVIVGVLFLLFNSLSFFFNYLAGGILYLMGLILTISFLALFLMVVIHILLVMAYFKKMRFLEIIKLAMIMAFKDILTSVLLVIILVVMMLLSLNIQVIMLVGGFSLLLYLMIKLSFKQYIKIYRKVEEDEN